MKLADRMNRLGTETAFEVLVRARALEAKGVEVVHLEIGEPDFDTPQNIIDVGANALREGWTHYGPSAGQADLREAIAAYINKRGTSYSADQVIVTPGGKPVMFFVMLALLQQGDEAIYPDPGFPIYRSMIDFAGAKAVPMPLREKHQFRLDVDELRNLVTPKTKLIIINSPANPTGGVLEKSDLEAIAKIATENDITVMSDEIYAEILYEGTHHSIAALPGMQDRTIILDGFSKTFAMTGWRLGYGLFPADLVGHINKLMVNSVSCTSMAVQRAGLEALTGPQDDVQAMIKAFRHRRSLIVDGLNKIDKISCTMPAGAFYAFPNITATGLSSKDFANRLLDEFGVAGIAGTSFGAQGEGYVRLSYANSDENLNKALARIAEFTATL